MRSITKALLLFPLILANNLYAGDVTLTWTPPTLREDGTTLDKSEIESYKIFIKDNITSTLVASPPSGATSHKLTGVTGTKTFVIRAVDSYGIESTDSNSVRVSFSRPAAPVSVKVTVVVP